MGLQHEAEQGESPEGRIGVYNEIDPLKKVLVWGEPGCEALLGQLLPENVSLFYRQFDVAKAREEFRKMQLLIEQEDVGVVRAKDAFVDSLSTFRLAGRSPKSLKDLTDQIKEKGRYFFNRYGEGNLEILDLVDSIVGEDAETYGEEEAIKLNLALSLWPALPMADIIYGRDQSSVLGDKIVISRMRWPIRHSEAGVFTRSLSWLGYDKDLVILDEGFIEGGDAIIFGDTCYIGVGVRTNRDAVADVFRNVGKGLSQRGIQLAAVVNPYLASLIPNGPGEEMETMHLDTFWMPIDQKTVLACEDEVEKRRIELVSVKDGKITFNDVGTFGSYITKRDIKVLNITKQEQLNYATNFLNLGKRRVIVPLSENKRPVSEMTKIGVTVIPAEIKELVGGYGAVHCMTAPLKRG